MKKIAVVGDGKVALDCLRILDAHPAAEVDLVLFHADQQGASRMLTFCTRSGIPAIPVQNVNDRPVLEAIQEVGPHLFFTIGSIDILRSELLEIPRDAVLNFHNGPLPGLRGVNVPAWAILRGNKEHAVTWHIVERGIDTGPVVGQRRFPIEANETAISLIFKCIQEGIILFEEILDSLLNESWEAVPQFGDSEYFSKKDLPNGGFLDFTWSFDEVSRFVRGLDFRPFPNPMSFPLVRVGNTAFAVTSVSLETADEIPSPGEVVRIDHDGIVIALSDSVAKLRGVADSAGVEMSVSEIALCFGLVRGSSLGK